MTKPATHAGCSPDAAIGRLGGYVELYGEVVTNFLNDKYGMIKRLKEAVAKEDGPETHRVAHAIKGTAGMCGADEVFFVAHQLERAGELCEYAKLPELMGQFDQAFVAATEVLSPYRITIAKPLTS